MKDTATKKPKKVYNLVAKTKYDLNIKPNFEKISMWKRDGWTEQAIAVALHVGYTTFNNYKVKYPEFAAALIEDNDFVIARSERTLMQMAWGTNPTPTVIEEQEELDTRTGKMKVVKRVVKYDMKPNITSLIFLMKNRAPEKWRDRKDVTVNSQDSVIEQAMDNFKLVSDQLAKNLTEENEKD